MLRLSLGSKLVGIFLCQFSEFLKTWYIQVHVAKGKLYSGYIYWSKNNQQYHCTVYIVYNYKRPRSCCWWNSRLRGPPMHSMYSNFIFSLDYLAQREKGLYYLPRVKGWSCMTRDNKSFWKVFNRPCPGHIIISLLEINAIQVLIIAVCIKGQQYTHRSE